MMLRDLDDSWHVFHGVKLEHEWDIDHIVIGPGGVFSISTKNQRGCFSLEGTRILLNGRDSNFAPQAMKQAMLLRKRLEALMGADVPFVQPILAAPFAFVDYPEKKHRVWVLHQDNLSSQLSEEGLQQRLGEAQIARIVKTIELLSGGSTEIWKAPERTDSPSQKQSRIDK